MFELPYALFIRLNWSDAGDCVCDKGGLGLVRPCEKAVMSAPDDLLFAVVTAGVAGMFEGASGLGNCIGAELRADLRVSIKVLHNPA